jgi:hypothetical protein
MRQLVVSGDDASELLELIEEALDTVALFVEMGVVSRWNLRFRFERALARRVVNVKSTPLANLLI